LKITHFIPDPKSSFQLPPVTAKSMIPQWYKDGESTYFSDNKINKGLKTCVPFLDSFLSGYLLLTSVNIYVSKNSDGTISINYDDEFQAERMPVVERPRESGSTIPRPAGHIDNHLIWTSNWGWKTPKGYSTLVTHPLNRFDLPFTTLTAIVDSDKFYGPGNIPFFLKEDFEGVIPKGTPFVQLIPIKRKKWTAVFNPSRVEDSLRNGDEGADGEYKRKFWQKKDYSIGEKNGK
jgi:hypothetical protein